MNGNTGNENTGEILISVVIPTCNRNAQLSVCLDCLRPGAQTLEPQYYEVIISDDSADHVARHLVEQQFPWARWVAGPSRGPAANRNRGASHAVGKYLAFTDDDCLPAPDWLSAYASAICDDSEVYEGQTTCRAGVRSPIMQAPINLEGGAFWACNIMIRRALFATCQFDETFPYAHKEDDCLREQLKGLGHKIKWTPQAVVDHPPRRMASARRLAAMHECDVIFYGKFRKTIPSLAAHLYLVGRYRLHHIRTKPIGIDTINATLATALELAIVATRYSKWRQRYGTAGGYER